MVKDITGQKFGMLTALYPLQERKDKCIVWQCECDCGKMIKVNTTDLLRHRRTTCGDGEHRKTVVIGERRGHLTLLRDTGRRDSKGNASMSGNVIAETYSVEICSELPERNTHICARNVRKRSRRGKPMRRGGR